MVAEYEEIKKKHVTWEHTFIAHSFENNICPAGITNVPVRIELPPDCPRSQRAVIHDYIDLTLCKLQYFFTQKIISQKLIGKGIQVFVNIIDSTKIYRTQA